MQFIINIFIHASNLHIFIFFILTIFIYFFYIFTIIFTYIHFCTYNTFTPHCLNESIVFRKKLLFCLLTPGSFSELCWAHCKVHFKMLHYWWSSSYCFLESFWTVCLVLPGFLSSKPYQQQHKFCNWKLIRIHRLSVMHCRDL